MSAQQLQQATKRVRRTPMGQTPAKKEEKKNMPSHGRACSAKSQRCAKTDHVIRSACSAIRQWWAKSNHVLRSACLDMSQWWAKPNYVLGSACSDMTQFLGGGNALKTYSVLKCPSHLCQCLGSAGLV